MRALHLDVPTADVAAALKPLASRQVLGKIVAGL
jgi:hypothetical protein